MRYYDTTFILNPQTDDATLDTQIKTVSELITTNGGKIVREERMGTRRLAFSIKGLHQGHYASFIFESEASVLPILERHYRLEEAVVRHLTVLFEGDPFVQAEAHQAAIASMFEKDDRRPYDDRRTTDYIRPSRKIYDDKGPEEVTDKKENKESGDEL